MALEQRQSITVTELDTNMFPDDAVSLACDLLSYARMHKGRFSKKQLKVLEHSELFARRTIEELD